MKRIFILAISTVILFCFSVVAFADVDTTISISKVSQAADGEVTVSGSITNSVENQKITVMVTPLNADDADNIKYINQVSKTLDGSGNFTILFYPKADAPEGRYIFRAGGTNIQTAARFEYNLTDDPENIIVAPKNFEVTYAVDTAASLTWESVSNATGYTIYYGENPLNMTLKHEIYNKDTTSRIISGLSPNTTYYFTIAADKNTLQSDPSDIRQVTTSPASGNTGPVIKFGDSTLLVPASPDSNETFNSIIKLKRPSAQGNEDEVAYIGVIKE